MKLAPIAGNADNFWLNISSILRPVEFMEKYYARYGDFYRFVDKNNKSFNITSNPQAIKEIFSLSSDRFDSGKANKSLSFLLGDNSLIVLDGKAHQNRRRLLIPPFHGESLQKCSRQIVDICDRVCNDLKPNRISKVRSLMQDITLKVISNIALVVNSRQSD